MPTPIEMDELTITDGTNSETYEIVDRTARTDIGTLSNLQTTEKSNLVGAINEVFSNKEVFWATYGTTTATEVAAAVAAGKVVCCFYDNCQYVLGFATSQDLGTYMFYGLGFGGTTLKTLNMQRNTSAWSAGYITLGTYSKPSGGIPASDLASAVQTSLGKADTALQSYTETDPTVPSWAKQSSKPSYTASEVGAAPAVTEVTVSTAGAVTQALDAGKIYHFTGALTSLTITLNAAATGQIAQYHFDFDSGSTAPTVTLPQTVTMQGGAFTPEASKHYEVDILNGYGVRLAW